MSLITGVGPLGQEVAIRVSQEGSLQTGDSSINTGPNNTADVSLWDVEGVDDDDFLMRDLTESQSPLALVCNPVAEPRISSVRWKTELNRSAHDVRFGISVNQRTRTQCAMWGVGTVPLAATALPSVSIVSLSQSTTTLTMVVTAELPSFWMIGTPFDIYGAAENRLAYQLLQVQSISDDRKTVVASYSEGSIIQTLTASAGAVGYARPSWDVLLGASDGAAFVSLGSTTTSGVLIQRAAYKNRLTSGLSGLAADPRVTISTTSRSIAVGGTAYSHAPASEYIISFDEGQTTFFDRGADGGVAMSLRGSVESRAWQSIPSGMRPFFAVGEGSAMARPLANIVSISRVSNVVTVTLDRDASAAGFANGNFPQVFGVRDTTNFPNLVFASNAITSVSGDSFTITWNGADATSRGGSVAIPCGGMGQQGLVSQTIQTVTLNANGTLTVIGNTTWSGPVVSDVVWLTGVNDASTGASLGVDGPWVVRTTSGTTITLDAVDNALTGVARRSPTPSALSAVSCGGAILIATVVRLYSLKIAQRGSSEVRIAGQGTSSAAHQLPVTVMGGAVNVVQSTAASAPGWPVTQGITQSTDVSSSSVTSTSTSSAISIVGTSGGASAWQLIYQVSAVSGTTPTLDVSVEATDDGTRWVRIWDMDRITVAGTYATPVFQGSWRSYRVVQTASGTSPSFTRSVIRNSIPFWPGPPRRRLVDRTAALFSTLSTASVVMDCGSTADVQVVVFVPSTTTTVPVFSIQAITADGVNYYEIGTLTTVIGKATQVKIADAYPGRLRLVNTTAGAGTLTGAYAVLMGVGF